MGDTQPTRTNDDASSEMPHSGSQRNRTEGRVVECDGQRAIIMVNVQDAVEFMENYWAVGLLASIHEGENRIIGQIYKSKRPGRAGPIRRPTPSSSISN